MDRSGQVSFPERGVVLHEGLASQTRAELPGGGPSLRASVEDIFRVGQLDGQEWETLTYVHRTPSQTKPPRIADPVTRSSFHT